jgi:hypothetical protein
MPFPKTHRAELGLCRIALGTRKGAGQALKPFQPLFFYRKPRHHPRSRWCTPPPQLSTKTGASMKLYPSSGTMMVKPVAISGPETSQRQKFSSL